MQTVVIATPRRASVPFIFITMVLEVLGFGLLIPVAPKLVQDLLNHGAGGTEQDAASYFGALTAIFAAMAFLCAPTLGALSDRFGRRPVLLVSIFGSGLDYFAMALSPTLAILFVTRAINGISGASFTVCNAYIADVTPPEKRAKAFGMVGAAFGLGFVLGPIMGGLLAADVIKIPLVGWTYHGEIRYPFYAAGVLTLINWAYGYFVLPESLPPEHRAHFSLQKANPVRVFAGVWNYPLVAGLGAALFFMNLAQFGLHATWVLYTGHKFGWGPLDVGLSLACVGVFAAIVQGGLARKIIPALGPGSIGETRALLLGVALSIFSFIGYGLATHGWMIYAIIALGSIGGIAGPACQALITKSVKPTEQGAIQGALTGAQSIAQILGPLIATNIFAYFISGHTPLKLPGASFLLGALLCAMGWAVAAWALARFPLPRSKDHADGHSPAGDASESALVPAGGGGGVVVPGSAVALEDPTP